MNICNKAYRYNAYIQSGVLTRANFAYGGELHVTSKNAETEKWINDMLTNTGLVYSARDMWCDLYIYGNFYAERIRAGKEIVAYEYISHPERIYHDVDMRGKITRFVQEIPERYLTGNNFISFDYYGDRKKTVKGIELPTEKILHVKYGTAEIPTYGRGLVAAVVNDVEVMLEIERAIAIISRYKAIPKKLIQVLNSDEPKSAEALANLLSNLADDENPIVVGEHKVEDLSYAGKEINFQPIVDYLKKKLTVSLAPSFLMHGEETNYAVSRDQRAGFVLTINSDRDIIKEQLEREIKILARSYDKKIDKFEIMFGDFDIGQDEDRANYVQQLFINGIVTLNEAREMLGYTPDKENGELYKFELQIQSQMFGGVELPNVNEKVKTEIKRYTENTTQK
jgi:hypothetical protein